MKLVLGVVEVPYADTPQTTAEIAEILEEKFGVMHIFVEQNYDKIVSIIEEGLVGAMESMLAGAPENFDMYGSAMAQIEQRFVDFINNQEHHIHLKKQDAPKKGARFKRQYRKAKESLAFYDSGLYRGSFKAWVEK